MSASSGPAQSLLRLQLLGGFRALIDGTETPALAKQPRRAALLTYLALERDVSRERVIALLWPDTDAERGRHSLNQAIYFLRRMIGADWVDLRGDRCVVAPWVTTDVHELEQAFAAGAHADVLRLYGGPLLGGTALGATADFEIWVDSRRPAIDRMHRRSRRQRLAELLADGRIADALQCAEEWCHLDPLEDEAQHRYMELLANTGQRGAALRQYDVYRRLLTEHDLKPLDETVLLIEQLQQGDSATLPERAVAAPASERVVSAHYAAARRAPPRWLQQVLATRRGLRVLLMLVFAVNLLESSIENWLSPKSSLIHTLRLQLARAAHWLEGGLSFEQHELASRIAVIGYSISYYVALPVLLGAVGFALARRTTIRPFRVFAIAVTIDYLVSLPFFLFFPMPERWWHTPSEAIVLSDRWLPLLIELYRPISALDNSFPSFHVSITVLLVSLSFIFRLRLRWSVLFLGACVVLATIALGIHWLADVAAGAAVGVIAVAIALRIDRGLEQPAAVQSPRSQARVPVHAMLALAGACACVLPATAHAQSTITYLEVSLDEDTRRADEKLRRFLSERTGSAFVSERPLEYDAVINRLAAWRPEKGYFLARTTPYAFVAAELLGAQLDGVATYVSAATGGTTYHSYFVVNRVRFPHRPELAALVDYLRSMERPATFVYHSKFSTSSYFLPALFFRSHGIYHMPTATPYHTAIHSQQFGTSSTELVRAVADGRFDLAAVWDGTKTRFEEVDSLRARYGSKVYFIQLPTPLPNDLLVVSAGMDSTTRGRIEGAIRGMGDTEINQGDFRTWHHINDAPDAREALANLRWLARERSPAVTVDVLRADRGDPVDERILEAARQAVRLSAAEFVNYDDDFHAHRDYVWTIERVRAGTIVLTSRIVGSDVDDQRFQLSYRDEEELTRRLGGLIHSHLHRIRYIWAYRPERPTIIRDIDFSVPVGSEVRVRRVHWLDVQRNHFQEDAEFVARVAHNDFFKLELEPNFVAADDGGFGFDPMSNISYRVILIRNASEPGFFRVLTVLLVILLALSAAAAVMAVRRQPATAL